MMVWVYNFKRTATMTTYFNPWAVP